MKKKRVREEQRDFFSHVPDEQLEESLKQYIGSNVVQTAQFDPKEETYKINKYGSMISCMGIHNALRYRYYPHYQFNRSVRKWKKVDIKGSTRDLGIRTDGEIVEFVKQPTTMKGFHKYTVSILSHITKTMGHTMQAAQIPLEILNWNVVTQCDLITRDKKGVLHVWEVKTGIPVGGYQAQGSFKTLRGQDGELIKCTGYNIWQLQLHFTVKSLMAIGLKVSHANSHVIQVFESKKKGLQVKIHSPEPWRNFIGQ